MSITHQPTRHAANLAPHTHHLDGQDVDCDQLTHCPALCSCPADGCTVELAHTPSCWSYALEQLDQNATQAGCTPAGSWGWLSTDLVPEWGATAGAIVATWLADGTASCTCEQGA